MKLCSPPGGTVWEAVEPYGHREKQLKQATGVGPEGYSHRHTHSWLLDMPIFQPPPLQHITLCHGPALPSIPSPP